MPAGMTVDPSSATGLGSVQRVSDRLEGRDVVEFHRGRPGLPRSVADRHGRSDEPPRRRRVAGSLYLASENENPYGTLLGGYVVIDDSRTGTIVKVPGKLETNESQARSRRPSTKTPRSRSPS